jgi:CheY-like chemotaxis protein
MQTPQTFLLIDDDRDDIEMLEEAITDLIPQVKCLNAINGFDALQLVSNSPVIPCLVFLDLNMPKMNGFQFLEKFKTIEKFQHVPIVIYTTSSRLEDQQQSEKQGASHFLAKPSSSEKLKKELEEIFKKFFQ